MHKVLRIGFAAAIGAAGWAGPAGAELSATRQVIAIMGGDLYTGTAIGHLSGAGTIKVRSHKTPDLACEGDFTSSKELGGAGELHCSDGASATFRFKRLSVFHGHGAGTFSRGTMSFTYGMTAAQSIPHLALPAGKKLDNQAEALALIDQ